ncbi:hypothetical protein [Flavobacterium sp.]|uniref:hypothetical protein n=1 Tax=Flavobacterium sp. TaxID=239 RepID=UPI00286E61E3|nr:hypothetical protein [Flavobacterium sp.]
MSIFKTIGTKLKRAISLKNVINAATGNFTAVSQELMRVATTKAPPKNGATVPSTEQVFSSLEMPSAVNDYLIAAGAKQKATATNAIANSLLVQDNVGNVNRFLSSVWLKATWIKYKTWFIICGLAVLGLIGWKMFSKKSTSKGRVRR